MKSEYNTPCIPASASIKVALFKLSLHPSRTVLPSLTLHDPQVHKSSPHLLREEVRESGSQKSQRVFANVPTEVGASEAEEVGVEHLLRDVKDATVSTLAADVTSKVTGLQGLAQRLGEIREYLEHVCSGRLPVNHDIMYMLQDVFNLLPNLNTEELVRSFTVKGNDMMLAMYLGSLIRSVLALHGLINNKEVKAKKEKDANKQVPPIAADTVKQADNTEDKTAASS